LVVVAIIPACNEQESIGNIVLLTRQYVNKVIVVDDGSTDNTASVASKSGAIVIGNVANKGYGFAIRKGFEFTKDADRIVTLDADGQHNPNEILRLLECDADIVIGSRFMLDNIKIPFYRRLGIWIITLAFNIGHKPITDSQSGMRAYKRKVIDALKLEEDGFGHITEILIKARKQGFIIKEVPIACTYRNLSKDSHMNPFKHGFSVLMCTLKWRIRAWN